jgi:hypothetical protein
MRCEVVRARIEEVPLLWPRAPTVDVARDMIEHDHGAAKKTVHIVPRGSLWRVVREGNEEAKASTYADLGRALDDATRGAVLVHVVVHQRENSCDAA